MHVEIKINDSSIRVEGELEEIKSILENYWEPTIQTLKSAPRASSKNAESNSKPSRSKQKKSGKTKNENEQLQVSAQELANVIKTHALFEQMKAKVLDVTGDWLNKCRLVAYCSEEAITSGDVKRVMDAFKIKSNLPTLSNALSKNNSEFLTVGDNPVKYTQTSNASSAFEEWLESLNE